MLGEPVQSDGDIQFKSPASNISLWHVGSRYARSWVKIFSRSCLFSAPNGS